MYPTRYKAAGALAMSLKATKFWPKGTLLCGPRPSVWERDTSSSEETSCESEFLNYATSSEYKIFLLCAIGEDG